MQFGAWRNRDGRGRTSARERPRKAKPSTLDCSGFSTGGWRKCDDTMGVELQGK